MTLSIKLFKTIHLKIKSLNILESTLLQAKKLVIPLQKEKEVKMVLFNLFLENNSVKLHIIKMVKQFILELSEDSAADRFDVFNLVISDGGSAIVMTSL